MVETLIVGVFMGKKGGPGGREGVIQDLFVNYKVVQTCLGKNLQCHTYLKTKTKSFCWNGLVDSAVCSVQFSRDSGEGSAVDRPI